MATRCVERAHEERVAEDREAAIVRAAHQLIGCERVPVDPNTRPVRASSATDVVGPLRDTTLSTTSGVVCQLPWTAA
jgi:hypothetical protein